MLTEMQKPSPHRFLPAQHEATAAPTAPQNPSGFRKQTNSASVQDDVQQLPDKAAQFARTPKFSRGSAVSGKPQPRSPPRSSFVQALQSSKRLTEAVEDSSGPHENDEMLDIEHESAIASVESDVRDHELEFLRFSPKRRRLDYDDAHAADQAPVTQRMQYTAPYAFSPAPAFVMSRGASVIHQAGEDAAVHSRPAFVRPPPAPEPTLEPLPETFSPHKRGAKFLAGGMASTVQQWVIETGQAAVNSRKGQGHLRSEDYVKRIKIDHITGSHPMTATGIVSDNTAINVLLAGKRRGHDETLPTEPGSMISVRAPTWDLELDRTIWLVAVDWEHLS